MSVQVIRRFLQCRRRQAFGKRDDTILDILVFIDEDDETPSRLKLYELDVAETGDLPFGKHDTGAMGKAGDQLACLGQQLIDGFVAPEGDLRFDLAALLGCDVANLEEA